MILDILDCEVSLDIVYEVILNNLDTEENYKLQGQLAGMFITEITTLTDEEFENIFFEEAMCRYVMDYSVNHTYFNGLLHDHVVLTDLITDNFLVNKRPTALDVMLGDITDGKFIGVEERTQEEKVHLILKKFVGSYYLEIHKDVCDFLDFRSRDLASKLAKQLIRPIFGSAFDCFGRKIDEVLDSSEDPDESFRTGESGSA